MVVFGGDKNINKYMRNMFIIALIVFLVYYIILGFQEKKNNKNKESYYDYVTCYPNSYRASAKNSYDSLIKEWCTSEPPYYDSNVLDNYDELPSGDEHSCPFNRVPSITELSASDSFESLTKSKCTDFYN